MEAIKQSMISEDDFSEVFEDIVERDITNDDSDRTEAFLASYGSFNNPSGSF